jgi:glucosamine--fructose-6-phosphate aminotransferase (isomerizing)
MMAAEPMRGPGRLMAAEMAEQPAVLAWLIARAGADADAATVRNAMPVPLAGVMLLARRSSDNAAVFGRYLAELVTGMPAGLAASSLYTRYHTRSDWSGYLVITLSQSGSTQEILTTCAAMRLAGARMIGLTNEPESQLADPVGVLLSTDAGPERAIPATKTMTAQILLLATAFEVPGMDAHPSAISDGLSDPAAVDELAARWR